MAATPIAAIVKYTARGSSKIVWCPAVADITAITRLELDAGTDLSGQVADASGWSVSSSQIETPDLDTRYTSTIPGVISAEDSSLTMYADREGVDGSVLMPRDEVGFIAILDGGDVPGNKARIFPVTVSSVSHQMSVGGGEADTIVFSYAITDEPAEGVAIPPAA